MTLGNNSYYRDSENLHDQCKKHLYYHTTLTMADGTSFDGIIENVDNDMITVLVGEEVEEQENENDQQRQYYGYGRPRRRYRRFRRRNFPLGKLAALALLPYIVPPPYPYYPYYWWVSINICITNRKVLNLDLGYLRKTFKKSYLK